jgi:SAM-dependent methyltransferase
MLEFIFLIFNALFAILMFYLVIAFVTGAPYVPSTPRVSKRMIDLAHIKKGERVYDLGSGDGRLLFLSAQLGANAYGIEINPYLVLFTWIKALGSPLRSRIHVSCKSFWSADITQAQVVFVYLLPWRMEKLERYLLASLKPGTRVVSNSFVFPHLPLVDKDEKEHIYVFKMP